MSESYSVEAMIQANVDSYTKGISMAIDRLDEFIQTNKEMTDKLDGYTKGINDVSGQMGLYTKAMSQGANENRQFSNDSQRAKKGFDEIGDSSQKAGGKVNGFVGSVGKIAGALGVFTMASKAINAISSSIDTAISRFDTLNAFPAMMEQLGHSAEDSEKAMRSLSDGINGLPTKLDEVTSTAQRLGAITGDLDGAVETTLALNNAFLASGASTADASRGLEQYIQMLSKGEVDLQSWRSLQETMPIALNEVAKAFEFTGKSAQNDLYAALKDGMITFDQFNDKIIELSNAQGGFAEMAKINSLGVETSMSNLRNSLAKGVADSLKSLNKLSKDVSGKDLAQNIDSAKVVINGAFKTINTSIESATPYVIKFIDATKTTVSTVQTLTPAIAGLTAAYVTYNGIIKTKNALDTARIAIDVATQGGIKTVTALTTAQVAAQMAATGATKAEITARTAQLATIKLSTAVLGVMNGTLTVTTVAQLAASKAAYALGAAWRFLTGPVGWIVAGVGLLVTGLIAVVKWMNRTSEEGKRLAEETDKLVESADELIENINQTSEAHADNVSNIKRNAAQTKSLADDIENLAKKENKSAGEKKILNDRINELNGSMEGLGLSYDEETNALSLNSEQIKARIDLMKEEESYIAAKERMAEVEKEQIDVMNQIGDNIKQQQELTATIERGTEAVAEAKVEKGNLIEKEQELVDTLDALGAERAALDQQILDSAEIVATAIEESSQRQILAYEKLPENQQRIVDEMRETWLEYQESATDMFNRLSDESKVSAEEMRRNMEENQRIISEWADNLSELAERVNDQGEKVISEGLMEKLRSMGPEGAGYINALVIASDGELEKLSAVYEKGAETASDAMVTSIGEGAEKALEQIGHMVEGIGPALGDVLDKTTFAEIGESMPDGLVEGAEKGMPAVIDATSELAQGAIDSTKETLKTNSPSKEFIDIGESIPEGAVKGVENGAPSFIQVLEKLASDSLTPFNDINNKFNSIGLDAMAGLNAGLSAGAGRVMATARTIANNIEATIRKALDTHSPSKKTEAIGKDVDDGLVKGMKKNARQIAAEAKKIADETLKNLELKYDIKKMNTAQYINELKKVQKQYKLTGDQRRKAEREIYKVSEADKKQASERTKLIKKINDDVKKADSDYLKKFKSINDKLAKDIEKVYKDYQNRFDNMQKSIYNQMGLFDGPQSKRVNNNRLLDNLKEQNELTQKFNRELLQISKNGAPKAFVDELREMGIQSAAEISAIADMPKYMLNDYVKEWKKKHELATSAATKAMEEERKQLPNQIAELKNAAGEELVNAKQDWKEKLNRIAEDTAKLGSFRKSGQVLGKSTTEGLIKGLNSMKGPLEKAAKQLAKTVDSTIKRELKINSPSKVAVEDGQFVGDGLILGMINRLRQVSNVAKDMAFAAIPDIPNLNIAGHVNAVNQVGDSSFAERAAVATGGSPSSKQPAKIIVRIGNRDFEAFVDDINTVNAKNAEMGGI